MLKKTVLRRKSDFSDIYNKGKSVRENCVVIFVRKNGLQYNRVAFLASKKVGNSVKRNRARRLMKESHREIREKLAEGYDLVFIARNTIEGLKCADVKKAMESAVRKAGVERRTK
jgi:ribonuclease P protein component